MFYTGSSVFPVGIGSGSDLSGFSRADIHDFQEAASELGTYYFESEAKRGNRETLDTSVLARNLMSVSGSMLNIELEQANFQYMFSDTGCSLNNIIC